MSRLELQSPLNSPIIYDYLMIYIIFNSALYFSILYYIHKLGHTKKPTFYGI